MYKISEDPIHRLRTQEEELNRMKKILTIAGSDCSGGAGVQADIKTITVHKMYAMSVVTALTAQNTTGVYGTQPVSPEFVGKQLDCIFQDIYPDAVKIGMVTSPQTIEVIAEKLKKYKAEKIVIDTVMSSSSGCMLLSEEAEKVLVKKLLPLADVITPNIPEAEKLSGINITGQNDMLEAARVISEKIKTNVLLKGGHLRNTATDLLYCRDSQKWYPSKRLKNNNTHGTGCTLSSAIACNLAVGMSLEESVQNAKMYLTGAIAAGLNLGKGSGPLEHNYCIEKYGQWQNRLDNW